MRSLSLALLTVALLAAPVAAEVWVDSTGKYRIEAKFAGLKGTNVLLRKADGKVIEVPYKRLNRDSQRLALKMSNVGRTAKSQAAQAAQSTAQNANSAFSSSAQSGTFRKRGSGQTLTARKSSTFQGKTILRGPKVDLEEPTETNSSFLQAFQNFRKDRKNRENMTEINGGKRSSSVPQSQGQTLQGDR